MNYHWKGNIRELKNVIEHMVIFFKNGKIDLDSLPDHVSRGNFRAEETTDEGIFDLEEVVKRTEIDTIKYEIVPGFIVNSVAIFVVNLIVGQEDDKILAEFDEVNEMIAGEMIDKVSAEMAG